MTYNTSEVAFRQVETYLDELLHSDQPNLTWETDDSRTLAYRIRQGFNAATKLGKESFADLKYKWIITEKSDKVIAKRRFHPKVTPIGIHKKTFLGSFTLSKVITTAIECSHLNNLHFPNLELDDEDIGMLGKWAELKGWKFNYDKKELIKNVERPEHDNEEVNRT